MQQKGCNQWQNSLGTSQFTSAPVPTTEGSCIFEFQTMVISDYRRQLNKNLSIFVPAQCVHARVIALTNIYLKFPLLTESLKFKPVRPSADFHHILGQARSGKVR